jgi:cell division protease FtsH
MRYGMDEKLGHVAYETERPSLLGEPAAAMMPPQSRRYSEETASVIDEEVRRMVAASFERAVKLLESRRSVLERGARLLLEHETLAENDLRELKAEMTQRVAAQ